MAAIPYSGGLAGPVSVNGTGGSTSTLSASGARAYWVMVTNRTVSADPVDISYDGGTTYCHSLLPGQSVQIGGVNAPVDLASVFLKCNTFTTGATVDVVCLPFDGIRL